MKKYVINFFSNPFILGSMVMVIGSNFVNFLNSLYVIVMGRLLGPEKYGELVSLFSVIGLVSIISISLGLVVIRFISSAKNENEIRGYISWFEKRIYILSAVIVLLLVLGSLFISSFLIIDDYLLTIVISLSLLFSLPASINRSVLQGLLRFNKNVLSLIVESIFKILIASVLVVAGFSTLGAAGGVVIAAFVGWYLSRFFIRDYLGGQKEKMPYDKAILSYAIPTFLQSIAVTSIYTTDLVLVKHFFSPTEAGLYAALATLGKIVLFASAPVSSVMFPMVAKRKSLGQGYKKIFLLSLLLTLLCSAFILISFMFAPAQIIGFIYGSKYLGVENLLVWFGVFISLFTLSSLIVNYYLSQGNTKIVYFPIIAALLQFVGIWIYHGSLFSVVVVSLLISSLLFLSLFVYFAYESKEDLRYRPRL